jgi:hypothetical protein
MSIDETREAIRELSVLSKQGHGGSDGVNALNLAIEVLRSIESVQNQEPSVGFSINEIFGTRFDPSTTTALLNIILGKLRIHNKVVILTSRQWDSIESSYKSRLTDDIIKSSEIFHYKIGINNDTIFWVFDKEMG